MKNKGSPLRIIKPDWIWANEEVFIYRVWKGRFCYHHTFYREFWENVLKEDYDISWDDVMEGRVEIVVYPGNKTKFIKK